MLPGTSITLNRLGYGAMRLAGEAVWGPPRDPDAAVAVLREAVALGVNHIDTSDYYGPHTTNQMIRKALHPYPQGLVIVTKVGYRRGADKSWIPALSPEELTVAVHDNLRNLGLEALDVVNLRVGSPFEPSEGSIEEPLKALVELKQQGLIRHIGVSNVTQRQIVQAQTITEIVCVQNQYNLAHREFDALLDAMAAKGIAPHWRFKLEHDAPIAWTDGIRGPQHFDPRQMSDPVVRRADGSWLYMLPSAIDDSEMGVSDVIRGEDHVSNTAAQIQMFAALGAAPPRFAHEALIVASEGVMSKRLGSYGVEQMRADGIEPEAVVALLARLGTADPVDPGLSSEELTAGFDLARFGRAPARFDAADLERVNAGVVHRLPYARVAHLLPEGMGEAAWEAIRPNLAHIDAPALVDEGGIARDDE